MSDIQSVDDKLRDKLKNLNTGRDSIHGELYNKHKLDTNNIYVIGFFNLITKIGRLIYHSIKKIIKITVWSVVNYCKCIKNDFMITLGVTTLFFSILGLLALFFDYRDGSIGLDHPRYNIRLIMINLLNKLDGEDEQFHDEIARLDRADSGGIARLSIDKTDEQYNNRINISDQCKNLKASWTDTSSSSALFGQCFNNVDPNLLIKAKFFPASYDFKNIKRATTFGKSVGGTSSVSFSIFYHFQNALKLYTINGKTLYQLALNTKGHNPFLYASALSSHEGGPSGYDKALKGVNVKEAGNIVGRDVGMGLFQITDKGVYSWCVSNIKDIKSREEIETDVDKNIQCGTRYITSLIYTVMKASNDNPNYIKLSYLEAAGSLYNLGNLQFSINNGIWGSGRINDNNQICDLVKYKPRSYRNCRAIGSKDKIIFRADTNVRITRNHRSEVFGFYYKYNNFENVTLGNIKNLL
jgi:hypothetical protein